MIIKNDIWRRDRRYSGMSWDFKENIEIRLFGVSKRKIKKRVSWPVVFKYLYNRSEIYHSFLNVTLHIYVSLFCFIFIYFPKSNIFGAFYSPLNLLTESDVSYFHFVDINRILVKVFFFMLSFSVSYHNSFVK